MFINGTYSSAWCARLSWLQTMKLNVQVMVSPSGVIIQCLCKSFDLNFRAQGSFIFFSLEIQKFSAFQLLFQSTNCNVLTNARDASFFGFSLSEASYFLVYESQVLGTDAGGTQEIIDHRVTGLLHPVGSQGVEVLAQNMQYLLNNPTVRNKMGMLGRKKVQEKYLKKHTYENFAKVLIKCMKIKQ